MPTDKQLAANRANAQHSTGPRTDQGKAASAQNATRHGLYSSQVVLKGESQAEFDAFLASYQQDFSPQSTAEHALVSTLAAAHWRRQRIERMEASFLDHHLENLLAQDWQVGPRPATPADLATNPAMQQESLGELGRYALQNDTRERQWLTLTRLLDQAQRAYSRALRDLTRLQALRKKQQPQQQRNEPKPAPLSPAKQQNEPPPTPPAPIPAPATPLPETPAA